MDKDLSINPFFTNSIRLSSGSLKKFSQTYPRRYQDFWANLPENNPLGQNDFIRSHGGELSQANYRHLVERANEKGIPVTNSVGGLMSEIIRTLQEIQRLEANHKEDLMEIAKDVVSKEYNIDRESLETQFMDDVGGSGAQPEPRRQDVTLTPELKKEIGRRSLLNGISQGAGLHSLLGIHHHPESRDKINAISEELLPLYDKFGNLISQSYHILTPEQIDGMEDSLAEQGTGWSETTEGGNVKASGMTFSIICQELVKGIVAKYTNYQFDDEVRAQGGLAPLTEEDKMTILSQADNLKHEATQIQFGTELWRRLLSASTGEGVDKVDVVSYLSSTATEDLNDSMSQVTQDPEGSEDLISGIQEKVNNSTTLYEGGTPSEDDDDEEGEFTLDEYPDTETPEGGEAPDDWDAIMRDLMGPTTPNDTRPNNPRPNNPNIDRPDLPPVDLDDKDDDGEFGYGGDAWRN